MKELVNLFEEEGIDRKTEFFEELFSRPGVRVERILSFAHPSDSGFWYDQSEDEWVVLVRGSAQIEYDNGKCRSLTEGDALYLPAGCRHRVSEVSNDAVWLAIFFPQQ